MSNLPEGWVETTLGEVSKVQTGPFGSQLHNEDYVEVGTPIITVEHIVDDKIQHIPSTPKVSDEDKARLSKYILRKGDIVFSRVGSVDRSAYVSAKEDGWMFSGRLLRVRGNIAEVYPHYLHYALTKESTKKYIRKIAVGATMPSINTAILSEVPIVLPPLPEQKAIADMLSSFDDKIELLREQNKTLETLAQTIFKEWFCEFEFPQAHPSPHLSQREKGYESSGGEMVESELGLIPKDWRVGRLGDVIKTNVSSINKNSNLDVIQYLDTGSLTEGHVESTQELHLADAPSRARRIVQHNDVLLSTVRPNLKHYGIIKEPDDNLIVSTGFCVISSEKIDPHFVYYLLTTNEMTDYLHSVAEGSTSTYPSIKPSDIEKVEFVLPPENILKLFSDYADKAWDKIMFNQKQIKSLSKTRDVLLPKLMSGKVRLNE